MKQKTTTTIVALTLAVCAPLPAQNGQTSSQRQEQAQNLYSVGVIAMREGKYEIAQTSFREVLRLYPKHTQARKNLLHILNNRNSLEINKRKASLKNIIIPSIDLDKATVQEAVEVLSVMIEQQSKKNSVPNFIVQDSTSTFDNKSITLRLNRTPADAVLKYIVDQAVATLRYDKHAIIIRPLNPKKADPTKATVTPSIKTP